MKNTDRQMDCITKRKTEQLHKRYWHGLRCCKGEREQCHLSAGEKPVADQALLLQSQQNQQELQLALLQERLLQCMLTWGLGSTAGLAEGGLGWLSSGLMELKHYPQMHICISGCLMLLL